MTSDTFIFADLILNTQQVTLTAVTPEPCISFTAVDDDLGLEGQEMLTLSLSGPPNVIFRNVLLTVIIDDGDGMYTTEVYSGYTAVLFPSTPPSMEEPSEDATLYIYIGLGVAAVVLIVAAIVVISLIVCLRKRKKMVNAANNAAHAASKDRMGLSDIAYGTSAFKGQEDPYEYVSTTANTEIDITTSANEAYAATDNVPLVNNQAYGMVHH